MQPRIGCAGIIKKGEFVLMGVRNKNPNKGKWIIPGGKVEYGETLESALKREILEETGITTCSNIIFGIYELLNLPDEHRIILVYSIDYQSGNITSGDDLLSAKFLSKNEIQNLYEKKLISKIVAKILIDAKIIH